MTPGDVISFKEGKTILWKDAVILLDSTERVIAGDLSHNDLAFVISLVHDYVFVLVSGRVGYVVISRVRKVF